MLGLPPVAFDDPDQGVVGVDRFEGDLDCRLVIEHGWDLAVGIGGRLISVPLEEDDLVGDYFADGDRDLTGVVRKAPGDSGTFLERGGGAPSGEIRTEFGGVVDGVEDLGERPLDLGLDLKFELHG